MSKLTKLINSIFLVFLLFSFSVAVNILVLEGVPSLSHHIWIRTLTSELAARGHNITSISGDIELEKIPNLNYIHLEKLYLRLSNETKEDINYIAPGNMDVVSVLFNYHKYCELSCEGALISNGLQQLLNYPKDFKFDLVLYDYVAHPCLLGLLHRFEYPPLLALSAFGFTGTTSFIVGSPFNSYVPYYYNKKYDTTFIGRIINYCLYFLDAYLKLYYLYPKMDEMAASYYPEAPKMSDLEKLTQIVLINTHPALEVIEPILPSIIPVGGIQIGRAKELPDDLKRIADHATNSLILFSIGSNLKSDKLGENKLTHILETFRVLSNYTFLWKFESDEFPISVPENVHIRPWMPQVEILAHPNTILFITHAGLLSAQESVWYGVPMLALPLFSDQFLNAEKLIRIEVAKKILLKDLNEKTFRNGILTVVENSKYRENVRKRSLNFRDQHEYPLERAVFWTEWLIRNREATFLRSPLVEYGIFKRQEIDVISFLLFVILFMFFLLCLFLYKIYIFYIETDSKKYNVKIKVN